MLFTFRLESITRNLCNKNEDNYIGECIYPVIAGNSEDPSKYRGNVPEGNEWMQICRA